MKLRLRAFLRPPRLVAFGALMLTGCSVIPQTQPDTTRYYVLSVPAPKSATPGPLPEKRGRVGLHAVEVPAFLRSKSMLVRVAGNEIGFIDEARWAEPLGAALDRVLRESLENRPEVAQVVAVTVANESARDLDVRVRVLRCEGDRAAGVARVSMAVEIYRVGGASERRTREILTAEIPGWDGKDFRALAKKLSEGVDQVAGQICDILIKEKG